MNAAPTAPTRPRLNGVAIFSQVLGLCLLAVAIDACSLLRIRNFEHAAHETTHASGVLTVIPVRRHGIELRLDLPDGLRELSCNSPGLGGSSTCDYRSAPRSGVQSQVDWVAAPGGVFTGTLLFPVAIAQGGEPIYQLPVDQVASVQARAVVGDLKFLGLVAGFLMLLIGLGMVRRRMRRVA